MGRSRKYSDDKELNENTDIPMSEQGTAVMPEENNQAEQIALPVEKTEKNSEETTEKFGDYTAQIIRDAYAKVDITYLSNKDPHYAYRFLLDRKENLDRKTGNALFQQGGWQICPKQHLLRIGIKEDNLDVNGHLKRGQLVLAFMPKKVWKEKEQFKLDKANAPMSMVKRIVNKGDPSAGAGIHETMKGLQTQTQLRM